MNNSDILIDVINECVNKQIKKSNLPTKIIGTVTSISKENKSAEVKIAGFDTVFEFLNKTGEILSIGDNVFIESVNGNLTNGFISERFGEAELSGGGSTPELSEYLKKTGDGKDVTVSFTEASSSSNINTGETLSTIFGKVKKMFSSLKKVAFSGSYDDLTNKPNLSFGNLNTNNSETLQVPESPESFNKDINLHKISKTGKSSDLINDFGFINKSVNNLENYYNKTEVGNIFNSSSIPTGSIIGFDGGEIPEGFEEIDYILDSSDDVLLLENCGKYLCLENDLPINLPINKSGVLEVIKSGENNNEFILRYNVKDGSLGNIVYERHLSDSESFWSRIIMDTDEIIINKQDKLIAGDNITIIDNVISATGGETADSVNWEDIINKPTKVSEFTNDANYATNSQVETKVDELGDSIDTSLTEIQTDLNNKINNKVDKVTGKGLSTNDYTTAEKNKLAGLQNYNLPTASADTLGGVKVGAGLAINNGILSATGGTADAVEWENVINKPTKLSEFENDSGYINDIKVNENSIVENGVANINIPTKLSELINDGVYTNIIYLNQEEYDNLDVKDSKTIYITNYEEV